MLDMKIAKMKNNVLYRIFSVCMFDLVYAEPSVLFIKYQARDRKKNATNTISPIELNAMSNHRKKSRILYNILGSKIGPVQDKNSARIAKESKKLKAQKTITNKGDSLEIQMLMPFLVALAVLKYFFIANRAPHMFDERRKERRINLV
jgi:hypothetical protein